MDRTVVGLPPILAHLVFSFGTKLTRGSRCFGDSADHYIFTLTHVILDLIDYLLHKLHKLTS